MRISDWSSDVCSADLVRLRHVGVIALELDVAIGIGVDRVADLDAVIIDREAEPAGEARREDGAQRQRVGGFLLEVEIAAVGAEDIAPRLLIFLVRSEEHTSELQSLMRISYAVCCLTKKTRTA